MAIQAYRARWVIDGISDRPIENAVVLVEDGKIRSVGADPRLPPEAAVRDLGEATLLPGLVDCHTHWIMDGSRDPRAVLERETPIQSSIRAAGHAMETLRCGVTTVRDVGSAHGISLALRDAIAAGRLPGPRVYAAGTFIVMTGGHGYYFGREADGEAEVRKAVREQLKTGADLIKVMASGGVYSNREEPTAPQFTLAELRAAVEEARFAHARVAMHAEGAKGIENAIHAGADTIEHGQYLTEETAHRMADEGIFLVPTIFMFYSIAENGGAAGVPEYAVVKAREIIGVHFRGFEAALKAGVKIAAGTDVGGPLLRHHAFPLQDELLTTVKAGLGPMEAIKSATSVAAEAIGGAGLFGSLKPGLSADLVGCEGNALKDLGCLKRLTLVVKEGRRYELA